MTNILNITKQVIPMFKSGEYFPTTEHLARLSRYQKNEKLFKGDHYQAFIENFKGHQKELLYVSVNLPSIICKKSADFLFGEEFRVYSGNGDGTPEQKAFDRFYSENNLNILTYESALSNSYTGDAFIKIRFGQEFNGMLPKELDKPRVFIENVDPLTVYPEVFDQNKAKVKAYHIAVPQYSEVDDQWYLIVESHYPSLILNTKYSITPMTYGPCGEVLQYKINKEISEYRNYIQTGVPMHLIVHIPNTATVGDWMGLDDLTEHHAIFDEINNRLSQIASILDKHADPSFVVPTGLLMEDEDGNTSFRIAQDKVFEVMGKDDVIPQYITWNGQLNEAFQELDRLVDLLLTTSEIPSVALGRGESGTSGSSGLAIKWRMNSLLTKINRKRQYYQKGLKQVFMIAQLLENVLDIADYKMTEPILHFNDGLPKDEMEQTNITSIRTGGAITMSQKTAIMQLNGMTEEQAEQEIRRIKAEQDAQMGEVDLDVSGETFDAPLPDLDTDDIK